MEGVLALHSMQPAATAVHIEDATMARGDLERRCSDMKALLQGMENEFQGFERPAMEASFGMEEIEEV